MSADEHEHDAPHTPAPQAHGQPPTANPADSHVGQEASPAASEDRQGADQPVALPATSALPPPSQTAGEPGDGPPTSAGAELLAPATSPDATPPPTSPSGADLSPPAAAMTDPPPAALPAAEALAPNTSAGEPPDALALGAMAAGQSQTDISSDATELPAMAPYSPPELDAPAAAAAPDWPGATEPSAQPPALPPAPATLADPSPPGESPQALTPGDDPDAPAVTSPAEIVEVEQIAPVDRRSAAAASESAQASTAADERSSAGPAAEPEDDARMPPLLVEVSFVESENLEQDLLHRLVPRCEQIVRDYVDEALEHHDRAAAARRRGVDG